jgi:multiple sugar transport system substrate-binding protein
MRSTAVRVALTITAVTTTTLLSACGSSDEDGDGSGKNGKVTITVEGWRPGSEQALIDTLNKQIDDFEKANPNIDVVPKEWEWKGTTFAAQLAGGTLPTTFRVPFTDGKGLIEREQIADLTDEVKALPYAEKFNPTVLQTAQSPDGRIYGLPTQAYGVGLHYNRALFSQAGLDPDKPPTTWDEVRSYAKTIADKTGAAGYVQMTKGNTGGWMLTTLTYALGGRMQEADGDGFKSTVDNPATKQALALLHQMRWEDNSMGSNFLHDWSSINQEFAAGKIGMYMNGSDVYQALVTQNNVKPEEYGLALIPLAGGTDSGVLGGGSIAAVSAKASDAEREAAVKWNDYYYMRKLTDEEAAVADAKALSAGKQPIGTPQLPIFDKATLDQANAWIEDYINVPLDQMSSFTGGIFDQQLVPEPPAHTQEAYAVLDSVVQSVLTNRDADVDSLLQRANQEIQTMLDRD